MTSYILLVEDDLDLAATIIDYLEIEDITCDHAANGIAGLQLHAENMYDMVILDVNMPRMDGLSMCKSLRDSGSNIPVLMLTARDTLPDKLAGFEVGTDDYMVKPFEMLELIARIKVLIKRQNGQSNKFTLADLSVDFSAKVAIRAERTLKLSPIGWKLLEALLRKSPYVVNREQLSRAVWGDDIPDSNSLKVHIFKLRQQIDATDDTKLLNTITGQGFALKAS
ncbi:response regulator transcription factor [Pseudoalteromonas denitrificans]|uniref:DNA-binding response regulator, OmpR family, contains REC and winged-helix (WHTH) domain n=1 Tax=Pseudoalteromonas denitrificans DSM 6059 TaxID=1123010 RepID=A0A1I1KM54_9GAMM|nr:response regulator transcription factor [Pseudoalteromonas denitrificans]SFC61781.1 DNA-binding response regulator, OmpR family, contains REC and winged-helix (wHTH) domain [Pseudoalteromonas denitrificans DSM 6059]